MAWSQDLVWLELDCSRGRTYKSSLALDNKSPQEQPCIRWVEARQGANLVVRINLFGKDMHVGGFNGLKINVNLDGCYNLLRTVPISVVSQYAGGYKFDRMFRHDYISDGKRFVEDCRFKIGDFAARIKELSNSAGEINVNGGEQRLGLITVRLWRIVSNTRYPFSSMRCEFDSSTELPVPLIRAVVHHSGMRDKFQEYIPDTASEPAAVFKFFFGPKATINRIPDLVQCDPRASSKESGASNPSDRVPPGPTMLSHSLQERQSDHEQPVAHDPHRSNPALDGFDSGISASPVTDGDSLSVVTATTSTGASAATVPTMVGEKPIPDVAIPEQMPTSSESVVALAVGTLDQRTYPYPSEETSFFSGLSGLENADFTRMTPAPEPPVAILSSTAGESNPTRTERPRNELREDTRKEKQIRAQLAALDRQKRKLEIEQEKLDMEQKRADLEGELALLESDNDNDEREVRTKRIKTEHGGEIVISDD